MRVEIICINDLLPSFETLLERAVDETISVHTDRELELWNCSADPHRLETAILNLAINARDALGAGGSITLATANARVSEREAGELDTRAGEYVVVSLRDTGSGMTSEVLGQAFEPFFTTKEMGRGTGLGLSQVYGYAKQSDGFVTIDSSVGEGTTVSIYLPRVKEAIAAPSSLAPTRQLPKATGAVLVVEDDEDVRTATCAMLEELGYTVRQAGSGPAALELLKSGQPVDMVLTDVIMPLGMSGIELALAIKSYDSTIPVLLTSGYTAQNLIPEALKGDLSLLRKPYTIDELADAISVSVGGR